jgi:hypothetical protein
MGQYAALGAACGESDAVTRSIRAVTIRRDVRRFGIRDSGEGLLKHALLFLAASSDSHPPSRSTQALLAEIEPRRYAQVV